MGNLAGQSDQQLTESLQGEYQVESHPYLLHRATNQLCTLHKITTNSAPDSHCIQEIVTEYSRTRCESISKLRAHYLLDRKNVCSNQQHYYLVFSGQNSYSLKDQVIKRRFYQKPFREEEIRHIVETYLCGLREYSQRFQRQYEKLGLDSMALDNNSKRIYLKDPWLGAALDPDHPDKLSQLMQSYPSPQKVDAAVSPKVLSFNQFLSNLFTVGVISLQLKRLEFADTVYTKKRELNIEDIRGRLMEFRDPKLRRGLELLLDPQPNTRKEVYMIWGIENRDEHYLVPLNEEREGFRASQQQTLAATQKKTVQKVSMNPQQNLSLSKEPAVQPKQVESIYIPATSSQNHQRTKTSTYVHFQSTPQENNNNNIRIPMSTQSYVPARPQQNYHPEERTMEPAKSFVSFKDYLNQEEYKPSPPPPSIPKTGNIQFQQNYPPFIRPQSSSSAFQSQPNSTYAPLKENIIFHEQTIPQPPKEPSNLPLVEKKVVEKTHEAPSMNPLDILKKNEETVGKMVRQNQKGKEVDVKEKETSPNLVKTAPQSKEISPTKEISEEVKSSGQTESTPSKDPPKVVLPNSNIIEEDTFFIKEEEKAATPKIRTQKNRYNSTIVEVRDEDTPDHSAKSQDIIEEEYVAEEYETGSRYEGFKSAGMRNGRGRFYYQDGGYYEGQWKNNKMDGYGKLYYEGGKLAYEGQWAQDEFNGLGKVYNDNPVSFQGGFDYTNFDYLEDYWQYYEGMLSHDTKEGRGRIKLSNGQIFEGDFHEDKIQGFGKFHTAEGKTIEGIWRESKLIKVISNG